MLHISHAVVSHAVVSCRQKEAAAANRKDSKLKAVVISEAWDKKSSKYNSPSVPFPFDSKTTYEQSMRTPMGREYNTTAAHRCDTVYRCTPPIMATILEPVVITAGVTVCQSVTSFLQGNAQCLECRVFVHMLK